MRQRVWSKVMKASVGTIGLAGLIAFGGSMTASSLSSSSTPTVAGSTPAVGYHLAGADGGVFNFGASGFYGSTYTDGPTGLSGSHRLNAPIVGIAEMPTGKGYWLVAADGGVFNFGDAGFYGNTYTDGLTGLSGSHPLSAPIVGIQSTPDGKGYWMVGADGGVFNFGNAGFYGSTYSLGLTALSGSCPLVSAVVGIVPTANGQGYWLATKAGFVYDFGSANLLGDTSSLGITGLGGPTPLAAPIVGITD